MNNQIIRHLFLRNYTSPVPLHILSLITSRYRQMLLTKGNDYIIVR